MKFYIKKRNVTNSIQAAFLKSSDGRHCLTLSGVESQIKSPAFQKVHKKFLPVYRRAAEMMREGLTGEVNVNN